MRPALVAIGLGLCAPAAARAAAAGAEPVSVIIVGTFHMSNPGHDLHNLTADDVLAPKRQAELAAIATALKRFQPTRVAVEWPAPVTNERYAAYLAGTLSPSRNEVVQLGFRLAQASGLASVEGIDVDGDFPYQALDTYARQHGHSKILEAANAEVQGWVGEMGKRLASGAIGDVLRFLNQPSRIANDNAFYRTVLRIGAGDAQPGADLLTAWYRRNFLICARLLQLVKPGDHAVVFYGSGHSFLLRQCVNETPGLRLVEADDYLPAP